MITEESLITAKRFYLSPYDAEKNIRQPIRTGIMRNHHGMMHAARATVFTRIFITLAELKGGKFTQIEKQALEIAALLHDSARKAEGVDLWDKASALNIYMHLKEINFKEQDAAFFAEVMANKDVISGGEFYQLRNGKWHPTRYTAELSQKYGKYISCIHDADCLDIMRVKRFDCRHLNFYANHQAQSLIDDNHVFAITRHLVQQTRSLISLQGDFKGAENTKLKLFYEYADDPIAEINKLIYSREELEILRLILNIKSNDIKTIENLAEEIEKIHTKKLRESLPDNIVNAIQEGTLCYRAIVSPLEPTKKTAGSADKESRIGCELRKLSRKHKHSNANRSVTFIRDNLDFYGPLGLLFNVPVDAIVNIRELPKVTGYGNKMNISLHHNNEELRKKLAELQKYVLSGISMSDNYGRRFNYNEGIVNLRLEYLCGIQITEGKTKFNQEYTYPLKFAFALYIQKLVKVTSDIDLPIVIYEQKFNSYKHVSCSEEEIIAAFKNVIDEIILNLESKVRIFFSHFISITEIFPPLVKEAVVAYYEAKVDNFREQILLPKLYNNIYVQTKSGSISERINPLCFQYAEILEVDEKFKEHLCFQLNADFKDTNAPFSERYNLLMAYGLDEYKELVNSILRDIQADDIIDAPKTILPILNGSWREKYPKIIKNQVQFIYSLAICNLSDTKPSLLHFLLVDAKQFLSEDQHQKLIQAINTNMNYMDVAGILSKAKIDIDLKRFLESVSKSFSRMQETKNDRPNLQKFYSYLNRLLLIVKCVDREQSINNLSSLTPVFKMVLSISLWLQNVFTRMELTCVLPSVVDFFGELKSLGYMPEEKMLFTLNYFVSRAHLSQKLWLTKIDWEQEISSQSLTNIVLHNFKLYKYRLRFVDALKPHKEEIEAIIKLLTSNLLQNHNSKLMVFNRLYMQLCEYLFKHETFILDNNLLTDEENITAFKKFAEVATKPLSSLGVKSEEKHGDKNQVQWKSGTLFTKPEMAVDRQLTVDRQLSSALPAP